MHLHLKKTLQDSEIYNNYCPITFPHFGHLEKTANIFQRNYLNSLLSGLRAGYMNESLFIILINDLKWERNRPFMVLQDLSIIFITNELILICALASGQLDYQYYKALSCSLWEQPLGVAINVLVIFMTFDSAGYMYAPKWYLELVGWEQRNQYWILSVDGCEWMDPWHGNLGVFSIGRHTLSTGNMP